MTKKRSRDSMATKKSTKLHTLLSTLSGPSLIKHLANTDPSIRSLTLRLIESWLTTNYSAATTTATTDDNNNDDDMKKLWKGLFYCVWHCDKSIAQAQLANKLSSLLLSLTPSLAIRYFTTFLLTLRREWPGIDYLRLDKFYLLIRGFIKCMFISLRKTNWDLAYLVQFMDILLKNVFLPEDKLVGYGVSYHIVSVFLDELKGCSLKIETEVIDLLFKPFFTVLSNSLDKVLISKVKSCIFDELLKSGKTLLQAKKNGESDPKDDLIYGIIAMKMGFSSKLYELSSSPECIQGNRKIVLGLHEEFLKLEKEFELSGIDITIPELDQVIEEVPDLIPIENGENSEDLVGVEDEEEKKRKNKKAKKGSKKKKVKKDDSISETEIESECDELMLNETVISNLQKKFEKVAEYGSDEEEDDDMVTINSKPIKKRKRSKSNEVKTLTPEKSEVKSGKKVSFDPKKNITWTPHNPMPPQSLRIPPSVTPRGSALKKGVPAGPVREMASSSSSKKNKGRRNNGRKMLKTVSPGMKKRVKKNSP